MSHYRKGDIVTIRGVVKYDADKDGDVHIRPDGHYADVMVPVMAVSIVQQAIEVGDEVLWDGRDPSDPGLVLAVENSHAWIDLGSGDYCTRMIDTVRRVEKSDE